MYDIIMDVLLRIIIMAPGFLLAISCHESAHAWAAMKFGDDSAKRLGRITLNPIAHIDLIGTIVLPLMLVLGSGGTLMFGWAKPVPVNSGNFRSKWADFWVSFAGPISNMILVVIFIFLLSVFWSFVPHDFYLFKPCLEVIISCIGINIVLAVFNLIPIPPLDGSHMLARFLSDELKLKYMSLMRFGSLFFILIIVINGQTNFLSKIISPIFTSCIYLSNILSNFFKSVVV